MTRDAMALDRMALHGKSAFGLETGNRTGSIFQDDLDRLQFGPADKFLLIEQIPIGFGGQISRRLLGLKLALALGRKAVFVEPADPPYAQTLESQCSDAPEIDWDRRQVLDALQPQTAPFLRFEYAAASAQFGNGGLEHWTSQKVAERRGLGARVNIDGEVLKWMRWLPSVRSEIEVSRQRLGVSASTLGVHLRRGDKTVEAAYVPARHVNAAIARVFEAWRFDSIFLASDSPQAAEEIELPRGVALIFDREEKRYNNANHKMLFRNPDLAWQETLTAAKNLALLSVCGGVVGQDNAHFATLASAVVASNFTEQDRIVLLHGQIAESESPALRRYFEAKRKARGAMRSLLPTRLRMKLLRLKLF